MDKVSSGKSHNCFLDLLFLCLSRALCQPLSPLTYENCCSKILNICSMFPYGREEESASCTATFVVVQRSFCVLWVSQRQFRVQVCVTWSSAPVWAASETRSCSPWASRVLPLFVFALAALTVGKLDQFADLMENCFPNYKSNFSIGLVFETQNSARLREWICSLREKKK